MKEDKKISPFGQMVLDAGLSQTDLHKKLEDEGIFKAYMTVHRWCTGECNCRDLFVAKKLAEILNVTVSKIVKSFE